MKRVTGIGGIFFKAKDASGAIGLVQTATSESMSKNGWHGFHWTDGEGKPVAGTTIWSIGSAQSEHFAPALQLSMVNYRVEDLHALVKVLREEGCNVLEKIDDSEYGKLPGSSIQKENKVELWQPPAGQ